MSSILQHNKAMDIRSKPTFVPHRHNLLFAFLHVCLCLYACLLYTPCALSTHLFLSITCLLVSCLYLCMCTHEARTHGVKARFPKRKQKGQGCEHVDISQAVMFSRFRGLALPFGFVPFKTPSFLLLFSLRWVVLGIS